MSPSRLSTKISVNEEVAVVPTKRMLQQLNLFCSQRTNRDCLCGRILDDEVGESARSLESIIHQHRQ